MHLRCWFARKMSQFTRFCGVKFLAWKSGCVKFLTNSMSDNDIILILKTFPLILSSIIVTDCAIICVGRTSTCWTSRQRSHWPRRWFVLMAMTPPTWNTSGGRWWQGWWWSWWSTMWSSLWSYQWPSTLWHQEHYDVHDMPEGREQAMCQLCDNLHQVVVAGIMMSSCLRTVCWKHCFWW